MWRPLAALAARGATGAGPGPATATAPGGTSTARGAPARGSPLLALLARHCSCVPARRARRGWERGRGAGSGAGSTGSTGSTGSGGSAAGGSGGSGGGWWWWWWRWGAGRGRAALSGPGRRMAALGAGGAFVWDGQRIEEEELRRSAQALQQLENPAAFPEWEQRWELLMERKHFRLWRRAIPGSHLFQYRVFGSYTDVTPRQFFNVQLDTEYRKKWDSLVIKLDVIDRDPSSGSELIHWVTRFPYPMYSRDYVYVRRFSVDRERNLMVLVSRAVEHPGVPEDPAHVRVRSYESHMVIRPHRSFDENGFDYLLTYSDNPQTVFPRYCLSWMVSSGMPEFLAKLHAAALKAKKMELEVRDYLSSSQSQQSQQSQNPSQQSQNQSQQSQQSQSPNQPQKGAEPRGTARLEYA